MSALAYHYLKVSFNVPIRRTDRQQQWKFLNVKYIAEGFESVLSGAETGD
jgi:hypothetical protein